MSKETLKSRLWTLWCMWDTYQADINNNDKIMWTAIGIYILIGVTIGLLV